MAHLEFDRLWAFSKNLVSPAEREEIRSHLAECPECQGTWREIEAAAPVLVPPPVPELSQARWRAIDEKVLEAAAKELRRPKGILGWLQDLLGPIPAPAFALAGAALVLALVAAGFALRREAPGERPLAVAEGPKDLVPSTGPNVVPMPVPDAVVPASGQAMVLSARDAEGGASAGVLREKTVVAKGAKVATKKRGELWMSLPDGSRMGLLSESQATLAELTPKEVRVELDAGAVAVAAVHEPARKLEVKAGEVTVKVVGTRFLVTRQAGEVAVAVEEGQVEVEYAGKSVPVAAGSSLKVNEEGARQEPTPAEQAEQMAQVIPPRPSKPRQAANASLEAPRPREPLATALPEPPLPPAPLPEATKTEVAEAAPPEGTWKPAEQPAAQAPSPEPGTWNYQPPPAPSAPVIAAPPQGGWAAPSGNQPFARERAWIDGQMARINANIQVQRWTPLPPSQDEYIVRRIEEEADKGNDAWVVDRTSAWLADYDGNPAFGGTSRTALRQRILMVRARCLDRLGRPLEAMQAREAAAR